MADERKQISEEKRRWLEAQGEHGPGCSSVWKERFTTNSGIPVDSLYTSTEARTDYLHDLGFPGEFPFTRGIHPTMYRGRLWTMRQYAGFGTAEESNARFKYLLANGQNGLSIAFDLPTQIGYDSDSPMAEGEVGKVGVAIDSLEDMEVLLKDIPLDKVSTSMTINSPASVLLAMYIAVGEKQGVPRSKLSGTIQNDILKEYVARGTYIYPPLPSMRLITDIFAYCAEHVPSWNTISISGYHIREAGSTAAQEVGFTLANGISYVRAALQAGLEVDSFAPQLSFFFNAHNDFFEEVAKFRAARRLWARIMKDQFGAKSPKSWTLRFHTQTGGSTLTAQQPVNNVVRVALQAFAAVCGGTQSLHTNSMDEALALPTEDSVRVALRTQQIIAHESGATESVDPLAGSYYVEHLTNTIEEEARKYIDRIDAIGGSVKAIETGYMQREIQDSAYQYQRQIESGKRVIVGMNKYVSQEHPPQNLLRVDPLMQEAQVERIAAVKARRNAAAVESALTRLRVAAGSNENVMPSMVAAVKAYATLQEICDVMRDLFGEHQPSAEF